MVVVFMVAKAITMKIEKSLLDVELDSTKKLMVELAINAIDAYMFQIVLTHKICSTIKFQIK